MTYRGPMGRAVGQSLASVKIGPNDEGAAELCRRYARLIDAATPSAVYAGHLKTLRLAVEALEDHPLVTPASADRARRAFDKIEEALAAHSVASDLGPKLLAALTALGLTVAGRPSAKGGNDGPTPDAAPKPESELDRLRRERRERGARSGRAAAMDPTAT